MTAAVILGKVGRQLAAPPMGIAEQAKAA